MSAAETALSNTSINEMLMGSLDNLTTQEKSTIVGAINEINSNKQAEDFVVTGEIEVVGGDSTKLLEGVNISATYEEIVEAYNAKKNVIFEPFVNAINATLRVPLLSYADETILFSGVDYEGNTFMFVCQSDNTWNGKWYSLVKGDEYFFTTLCAVQRRSNNELYFLQKSNSGEDIIEEYKKGKQVRLLVSELVDKSYLELGYFELTETDESTYCIFSRNVGLNTYFRIHVTLDTYEGNYFTFPLSSDVQENYIITCTASDGVESINGKELYIDNVSTTFEEIINAYEEGKNIKLLFDYEGSDIIADFVIKAGADDIGFCVTIPYLGFIQIDCHPYNGWSGYITYVVKKNEINNLETQIGDINTTLENKSDKPQVIIWNDSILPFEFSTSNNVTVYANELTTLSITFGDGVYDSIYMADLSFDSGATPTSIDYTDSGILNWVGTDCATSDGLSIFQPSANTHYDIVFYFNGAQFIGLVNGFIPSTGNEAV
jgi:hypothetical protein